MQTLIDFVPHGYNAHNTGGEHANRITGDEIYINELRIQHDLPASAINPADYAAEHDGYVVLREELSGRLDGISPHIAGYVLAQKTEKDKFGFSYTIDEVLVDVQRRGRGLGSFLLGELASKGNWLPTGDIRFCPKSLLVPSEDIDTQTRGWLESRGFFQDDSGLLRLRLPGSMLSYVPEDRVDEITSTIPDTWNGSIGIEPEDESAPNATFVYRQGQLVGSIALASQTTPTYKTVHGTEVGFNTYTLNPLDGEPFADSYSSAFFAVVGLLQTIRDKEIK